MILDTLLFPTLPDRAAECARLCAALIPGGARFVDVSADGCAFADFLTGSVISIDAGEGAPDFQDWMPPSDSDPVVVVGTPAFGADGTAPLAVINHAATFADYVALLLPASFARNALKDRVDPFLELVFEQTFPEQLAIIDGELEPVRVVFQIWKKRSGARLEREDITSHAEFEFAADPKDANFLVRGRGPDIGQVVEVSATTITGVTGADFYIRAVGLGVPALRRRFERLDYADIRRKSFGAPWIGQAELVDLYDTARCLDAIRSGSEELEEIIYEGASALARFLDLAQVYSVKGLVETVTYDTFDDLWEEFGTLRGCRLSERTGEYAVLELNAGSDAYSFSFSVPFDVDGKAAGAPRLVLESRTQVLWEHVFPGDLAAPIVGEAEEDIAAFLDRPIASEEVLGECRPDHRIWQEKMLRLARDEVDRIRQAQGNLPR